jgi:Family of unknown function (DUF5989)
MAFLRELCGFIRQRRHYWLIPFFVPVLAVHGLAVVLRLVVGAVEDLPRAPMTLLGKLYNNLAVTWARAHLRYFRHT